MAAVLASHSMSLDGFIAQLDRKPGPLHEWLWAGDQPSRQGETFMLSAASRAYFDQSVDRVGATIAGRRTYDDSGGWGGRLPFDWPSFIVTHDPPANGRDVPFSFVTEGVERAVEQANAAAGDKDVIVMGGEMTRRCLAAGLLDEIQVDLVPIVLGAGVRLFDELETGPLELERTRVVEAPGVTHICYRVVR